jgi:hypothetical protein
MDGCYSLQEENGFSSAYLLVTGSQFGHSPSSAELSAVGGVDSDSHYRAPSIPRY